jgi:hypothetical protein
LEAAAFRLRRCADDYRCGAVGEDLLEHRHAPPSGPALAAPRGALPAGAS